MGDFRAITLSEQDLHLSFPLMILNIIKIFLADKKADSTTTCSTETEAQSEKNVLEESLFHDAEMDLTTKSATSTTKDEEEDLDETELTRLKEFLEEAVSSANGLSTRMDPRKKARVSRLFAYTRKTRAVLSVGVGKYQFKVSWNELDLDQCLSCVDGLCDAVTYSFSVVGRLDVLSRENSRPAPKKYLH